MTNKQVPFRALYFSECTQYFFVEHIDILFSKKSVVLDAEPLRHSLKRKQFHLLITQPVAFLTVSISSTIQ